MNQDRNQEIKQKIAAVVCEYLQRPFLPEILQQSYVNIYDGRAEFDYESKRFYITVKNPHVLFIHTLVVEGASEK